MTDYLDTNAIARINVLQRWFLDSFSFPSSEELLLFSEADVELSGVIKFAAESDEKAENDEWCCKLVPMLRSALQTARLQLNNSLQTSLAKYHAEDDRDLLVAPSAIACGGLGLFTSKDVAAGETVCYYAGLVYNFNTKNLLEDQSYLLYLGYSEMFDEDIFIDSLDLLEVKGRYMNDPLNETLYNVKWSRSLDNVAQLRCGVVATRDIIAGEEIFVSYGSDYWLSSSIEGSVLSSAAAAATAALSSKCTDQRGDCPVCEYLGKRTVLLEKDLCPSCGSLEGLSKDRDLPKRGVVRAYDWANGSVAPWSTRDGTATYATPVHVALDALKRAGISETISTAGLVIDLGCGDAQILRAAASTLYAKGIGFEIDPVALLAATQKIKEESLQHLVEVRNQDLMKIDLIAVIKEAVAEMMAAQNDSKGGVTPNSPSNLLTVVITAFLLPASLKRLRIKLQNAAAAEYQKGEVHVVVKVVTFKWNMEDSGERWEGKNLGELDAKSRFTIYE